MGFTSATKAWGFGIADAISTAKQPWEPFRRPFSPLMNAPLEAFEICAFEDIQDFWTNDHSIIMSSLPLAGQLIDLGDQAIWHGYYTGILCIRHHLRPTPEQFTILRDCLRGIRGLLTYHGELQPRLIRGFDLKNRRMQDDASNDSLTGVTFGLYCMLRWGPQELKAEARTLFGMIVESLMTHDLQLVNALGKPTTHGKLINGVATDGLQFTLVFAILSAYQNHVTFSNDVAKVRAKIYDEYKELIPFGKAALNTPFKQWENWNDDHRAATHLMMIFYEDFSPRVRDYVEHGFRRLWLYGERRANPWVNAFIGLCSRAAPTMELQRQARGILSEWDFSKPATDVFVDSSTRIFDKGWKPKLVTVDKKLRSTQPLPYWAMGKQDFPWQRNRFSVTDWTGHDKPTLRFNSGAAFCGPYWLSRLAGIL